MKSKTAIYLLISVCIVLLGLALLFAFKQHIVMLSISTSIIAGGISSLAFGFNRYLEEIESQKAESNLTQNLNALSADLNYLDRALQDIRTLTVLTKNPNERRIYDRHPEEEFRAELKAIRKDKQVNIDVVGFSLNQFCTDYLDELIERGNVHLRLLIQHPLEDTFALACHQEGREEKMMAEEVLSVTEKVTDFLSKEVDANGTLTKIELRWFPLIASVTLTRLNQVVFVRARYLKEANHPPMVFERYYELEGRPFVAFINYFQVAWDMGVIPTKDLYSKIKAKYSS